MPSDSVTHLKEHLNVIAVPRHGIKNSATHRAVSDYIRRKLSEWGLAVEEHRFAFEGGQFSNWIAAHPEDPKDLPLLILGAHYDTVADSPGADDNASGVAVLLETARSYMERRRSCGPAKTGSPRFVFFDLEEFAVVGSKAYVEWLTQKKIPVAGMLCLEMLGCVRKEPGTQKYPKGLSLFYPSRGDFIALIGSLRNPLFFWKILRGFRKAKSLKSQGLMVPGAGTLIPDVRLSDHAPFWDAGIPAVFVTDTAFLRNPDYHLPSDTIEKVDLPFMADISQALAHVINSF